MLFQSNSLLFRVFLLLLSTEILVQAKSLIYSCPLDDNYTDGSVFESNLRELLSSLKINAINSGGFSNLTVGDPMSGNQVSGVVMCYGDKTPDECEACINSTTESMTQVCPHSRRASVIDDRCYLRYSNENFLGILTSDQDYYDKWIANATNQLSFNKTLYMLIDTLSKYASNAPFLYSTDYSQVSGSNETIYALVQCRRDLSAKDCNQAIADALQYTQKFGSIRQSVVVYLTSCYLRYSVYPFAVTIPAVMRELPPPPPPMAPSSGSHSRVIVIVVISTILAFGLILGCIIWIWRRKRENHNSRSEKYSEENGILSEETIPRAELHVFDMKTLIAATNNFSKENLLGEGGFGPVYKGTLRNGEEIAVKKLKESSKQGAKEFEAEVRSLAALRHRNLVQLIGYYKDGQEQLLCYEYLPDGSLDDLLFGTDNDHSKALNWETRFKIAQGISCGLRYVHEESIYKIVHRDLKPANILLDKDMNPKISDFGTAKFFIDKVTHKFTTNPILTRGYGAPEYHLYGKFSFKSDVYSFGVILLDIVTGQKSSPPYQNTPFLIKNVIQSWVKGNIEELIDPRMGEAPIEEIKRCIQIGLCCLNDNASRRPTMGEVDLMLQGYMEVPPISDEWLMSWMDTFSSLEEIDSYQTQRYIMGS